MQKQKTTLVWFKTNLRSQDSVVLQKAMESSQRTIGVYCISPNLFQINQFGFKKMEVFRAKFLLETLQDLTQQLNLLNVSLLVYFDTPETVFPLLIEKYNICSVYYEKEWTHEECEQIQLIKNKVRLGVDFHSYYDQFLFHPDDVPFHYKDTPKVFTPFRKILEKQTEVRPIISVSAQEKSGVLETVPQIPSLADLGFDPPVQLPHSAFPFKGGETHAKDRLNHYLFKSKQLGVYKKTRNGLIGTDYSSKFSAWLANGSLSARQVYWAVKTFEQQHFSNQSTYWMIFELIWRDFFKFIALKHGNSIFKIEGILNQNYNWSRNQKYVNQWINGTTPDDFVNANMIELKKTGWMSNRGRQNVASYFAKNQKLDWRIGAAYFESILIDYDVHSNYGNWMYVSGVGNDPRDRVFNVKSQAERYDPHGKFRKVWLQSKLF